MKRTTKDWIFATRPWALPASIMPTITTISYIFYKQADFLKINWYLGILALIAVAFFHLAGNLFNDYFDFIYNVDRKEDTYSNRILVDEIFKPKEIFIFAILLLLIGIIIGIILSIFTSYKLLIIGGLGIIGTVFYNKAKNIALGDLCIFLVYGQLIALGTAFVLLNEFYWKILLIIAPIGLLIVAILHANNTRDILNDAKANIKTFAMILNLKRAKIYFTLLIIMCFVLTLILIIIKFISPLCLLVFFSFPIVLKAILNINKVTINNLQEIKTLNEMMAKYVLIFSMILFLANIIAGIFLLY